MGKTGNKQLVPADVAAGILDGDRRMLARAITLVENESPHAREVVSRVHASTGNARIMGITGPPGVGKSSLISALVTHLRRTEDEKIGVISVDPSSPFSSGAVLGDRIRLADHFLDSEVFIRSMGTRGHLGGVAEASLQSALLMDAFGKREVLIESVGVGQSEVEIVKLVDTVVLVLMPGSGDAVQALKAGVMEIPDVIVINKADHPQAKSLRQQIRGVLTLDADREWVPEIIETQAITGDGVEELWEAVLRHRAFMAEEGRFTARRHANIEYGVSMLALARAQRMIEQALASSTDVAALVGQVQDRTLDPATCVDQLYEKVFEQ